jgi:photosystem II stability/assembly factor-like uncharacterized protein
MVGTLAPSCAPAQEKPTQAVTPVPENYVWKNVAISGIGCWVTGIAIHPRSPHITYMRTDVGGAYRWDTTNARWIPLVDHLTYAEANYFGIESIALDVNQPDVVYLACGTYTDKGDGIIMKSNDRGATWTRLNLKVPMGSNQARRWGGERLAVSPHDGKVLLFGSRRNGLWRTTDAGHGWKQVQSIPVASDNLGVGAVAFDPAASGVVYAAVSGFGIYHSPDNGATWNLLPGSPDNVRRMKVGEDHSLWVTHGAGVSKYAVQKWQTFAPGGQPESYCGIAINPQDPRDVLVSDLDGRFKAPDGGRLYRTRDGGTTWKRLPSVHEITVPWGYQFQIVNVSDMAFNPQDTKQVWAVSWSGVLRTDDIDAATVKFPSVAVGHEESCINMVATPPIGPELVSATLDLDGFVHDRGVDQYPSQRLGMKEKTWIGHTLSVAYQEKNPSRMMRTGTQGFAGFNPTVAVSSDAGASWYPLSFPPNLLPLHGAISSGDHKNMVVMCNANVSASNSTWQPTPVENPWQYTLDGGATWSDCAGLPRTSAADPWGVYGTQKRLAADPENSNTFYVYSQNNGKIYRSTDGGANFSHVNSGTDQGLPTYKSSFLKAQPGVAANLWLGCTQDSAYFHSATRSPREGLYHSRDGGATWEKITRVASVVNFAFGKAAPGSAVATLYFYGRLEGDSIDKIYRSINLGQSWQDITDPGNPIGNQPLTMEGSRQTFGRIFIGTNGRGIFYGQEAAQ